MAYFFGDGFDLYASTADMINAYWDSSPGGTSNMNIGTGRFTGSRGLSHGSGNATIVNLLKNSSSNDAVHHLVVAITQSAAISGTTNSTWFTFGDSGTNQCTVVFRSDGAILLNSGNSGGTNLATYTGALTASNVWYAFEIEIRFSATAGYMNVRKNGNTTNDFSSATNLNTITSSNNYANRLSLGCASPGVGQTFDDLLWRSDASSVPWIGDVRCYTRMPASDASVHWTPSASAVPYTPFTASTTQAAGINNARYMPFTAPCNGTVGSVAFNMTVAQTGNWKAAIYNSSAGSPTTFIATSNALAAPGVGTATFTFASPPTLVAGTAYFAACINDGGSGTNAAASSGILSSNTTAYSSWPVNNPGGLSGGGGPAFVINITPTGGTNYAFVSDSQQDAANSYVYSSTVGQSDLYTISSIGSSTPASIVGVVTRGYFEKSDAGTRNIAVQLNSLASATLDGASAAAVTLSGGNLVATNTGTTSTSQGARVASGLSAGKYYFEFTITTLTGGGGVGVGVDAPSQPYSSVSTNPVGVMCYVGTGNLWGNSAGNLGYSLGARSNGNIIGIALDLVNNKVWFRVCPSGLWDGIVGHDPTNPTSGGGIGFPGGSTVPFVTFGSGLAGPSGTSSNVTTANFGASAFNGAVPSGYTSGFPGGTTVQSSSTALNTVWGWVYRNDLVDPATGATWTATGVNNAQIGAIVTA